MRTTADESTTTQTTTRTSDTAQTATTDRSSGWTPSIFISYRKADSADVVEKIADQLKSDLHHSVVFRDGDDLHANEDYASRLDHEVSERNTVLAFVGERWATGYRANGAPYDIADPDDWVRRELRLALTSQGSTTPVLIERAGRVPDLPDLPADIAAFAPDDAHRVTIRAEEVSDPASKSYRRVLGAIWAGAKSQVDDGILVIGDISTKVDLDAFVDELCQGDAATAVQMAQIASNVYVLQPKHEQIGRFRKRRLVREWPDAVLVSDDGQLTEYLRDVKAVLDDHPAIKRVAVAAAGGALIGGTAAVVGAAGQGGSNVGGAAFATSLPTTQGAAIALPIAAKVGIVGAVVAGGGVGAAVVLDGDTGIDFAARTELHGDPLDESSFYFADPPPEVAVRLSSARPTETTSDLFADYVERDVIVEIEGVGSIDVGTVELPTSATSELFEFNDDGTYELTSISTDIREIITQIPVEGFCYRRPNIDDRVGGFHYTGSDGTLTVRFFSTIEGGETTGTDLAVVVGGSTELELTEPVEDDFDTSDCRGTSSQSDWATTGLTG